MPAARDRAKNNRVTSEEVGELAGLSATACQRRLKRLRSEGIIEADISIVTPKAAGSRIQMLVLVSLERERTDIIDKFKKAVKSLVEVGHANRASDMLDNLDNQQSRQGFLRYRRCGLCSLRYRPHHGRL